MKLGAAEVPTAELHVHLEGTVSLAMLLALAARKDHPLDHPVFHAGPAGAWTDFATFLSAYEAAAAVFQEADDYRWAAREYLCSLAADGALYAELTVAPQLAARNGVGLADLLEAVAEGIEQARDTTGIEARILAAAVRHLDVGDAEQLARAVVARGHPLVTGFGLAGDERVPASKFMQTFEITSAAGLGASIHAGEVSGPKSVWDALALPIQRIGHGVRSIEDALLVAEIARRGIVLECCPGSNVALGIYADLAHHPIDALRQAGVQVTLNSDDPAFFGTTLADEYRRSSATFEWDAQHLRALTATALSAAFVDDDLKAKLLARLRAHG